MEQQTKKPVYKRWWFWVVSPIALIILICIFGGDGSTPATSEEGFPAQVKARFDNIAKSIPELEAVNCEGDCTNVVYFDFKTTPDDLETIVRGNAATFSKFKMDNNDGSNVTIAARVNSNVVFYCDASQGVVKECK